MTELHLEAEDGHIALVKVMAIARMNDVRVVSVSYEALPGSERGGVLDVRLGESDETRIGRVVARVGQIVGVRPRLLAQDKLIPALRSS